MNRGIWLGFIFFVALVVLGFGTLLVKHVNVFGHPVPLRIHFERAEGLRPGSDVRVDGMLYGRVNSVSLHKVSGVQVLIELNEPIVLYQDAQITVEPSSVLGGNIVAIRRGSKGEPQLLSQELAGTTRPGLEEFGELASENKENLRQLIANLKDVSQVLKDGQGTVGKLLKSDELHKEAVDTVKSAREAITEAKVEIKKLADNLNDNITKLTTKLTDKLDKAEGPIGPLLNDKKLTERMDRIVANVEETSKNLKEITDSVKNGEGALGKIVNDKEMGEKLKSTINNVEQASESIKNIGSKLETGEGSVGKLLQDDELYENARKTLGDIDRFFGRAANARIDVAADYKYYSREEMSVTKLGLRIGPDEDKFLYAGGDILGLNKNGTIDYKKQQEFDISYGYFKPEVYLAYRAPWLLDRHLLVRAGYLEGKPGGALDFSWQDFGACTYPITLTLEGRDTYKRVDVESIDEGLTKPLFRAYLNVPLWIRNNTWWEMLLSMIYVTGGIDRIGSKPEAMFGVGGEWADQDVRTLVALIGTAR
jgi:phospholipid/cholesterol/gamma-HCH transport system substrate-binding protein